ncbi:MAG: adenylosuccinate lyase [Gammaproteobacteria bacterium]
MDPDALTALSPVDGRYAGKLDVLRPLFSEYGLIRLRVRVEVEWLRALAEDPAFEALAPFGDDAARTLEDLAARFDVQAARRVKAIEARTNHDVKAVEYWLRECFEPHPELARAIAFIHFACTSEDINNVAYALMLAQARAQHLLPAMNAVVDALRELAHAHADRPMLARTHGQAATPTTLGKEMAVFAYRMQRQARQLESVPILAKLNGAVGNFNAHLAACPEIDWPALSERVLAALGLQSNPYTTQIEPHDFIAEYGAALARFNTVMLDLCRDVWSYISIGYFRQRAVAGEVGSSTMPHKVNPIDFENAEGNIGIANALFEQMGAKLPVSRWQRDLSDSTTLRNIGVAVGHTLLACQACLKGLSKLEVNQARIEADLDGAWEVLAEAIQTVMRRHGIADSYEQLKALTRGQAIGRDALRAFIAGLAIPQADKDRLQRLTPASYTGIAARLAREV